MAIIGVKSITYAVEDIELAAKFWADFGLKPLEQSTTGATLETSEGSQVVLAPAGDPALPPAPVADPTARLIVWGAQTRGDIEAIAQRMQEKGIEHTLDETGLRSTDPCGYALGVELWNKRETSRERTLFNAPNAPHRIDRPAPAYDRAAPDHLAHVVLLSPRLDEMIAFYSDIMGFKLSDSYPGFSCFLRCPGATDHHNVYLLRRGELLGFHHISFDVNDVHELFGGGLFMQAQGWKTHLGPGRHPTSSAYFWYFVNPCGGAAEYDFDADVVTDQWQPREMVPSPELFAEWALHDGIHRYKGEQKTHVNDKR